MAGASKGVKSNEVQEFDKGLHDISINIINGQAKSTRSGETPINEGSWAKKGVKSFFGYKGHRYENYLIRDVETTTASVHDSKVDLEIEEVPCYADKGYRKEAKKKGWLRFWK